jgi:hypothetical protein
MFNASGDQMDITSPNRPSENSQPQNTLPAFLLGTDSHFNNQETNKNYFNNTPLKGRNPNQLQNQLQTQPSFNQLPQNNSVSDLENRAPTLLFSNKYRNTQGQNNSRPFSHNQPAAKVSSSGPPVASLGQGFRSYGTEPLGSKLGSSKVNFNVMASSPLPDKQGQLPRIATPDFSSSQIDNSPITSPILKPQQQHHPSQGTPLRQVLEKRHNKQAFSPDDTTTNNNSSFLPEQEIDCWISVFGFNSRNKEKIIKYLTACGSIVCRQPSKRQTANWVHLRFASPNQAKRARQRFNCQILESECAVIGVVECLEPGYILEYIKSGGVSANNVTCNDMDMSKIGMRSLVEPPSHNVSKIRQVARMEDDPFNMPQQEANSVVRRTLTYLLPSYF